MTENIEGQVWYKNSLSKRLEILKSEAEVAVTLMADNFPEARIYLFGSTARKLLGNKERFERNIFSNKSDLDLWIELPEQACNSAERFDEIEDRIKGVLNKRRTSIKVDCAILVNRESGLWPGGACFRQFFERLLCEIIDNREMILLYGNGEFFIPWREEVVK